MIKTFDFDKVLETEKYLNQLDLKNKKLGLAVSGGRDSCILLDHFLTLKKRNPALNFSLIYVHHGVVSEKSEQDKLTNQYRHSAAQFCLNVAKSNQVTFFTNPVENSNVESEEELRNIRVSFFVELKKAGLVDVIVTAHHQRDLLETRLMRLLRGSGPQGLESMTIFSDDKFKPMLYWPISFIEKYTVEKKIQFVDDPSNLDTKYFRNWIRGVLFKSLEGYQSGSVDNLARSLELISEALKESQELVDDESIFSDDGILREKLILQSKVRQRQILAKFLRKLNISGYTHSHIDEILKRLDSSQRELTFQVLGLDWTVDTRCIYAKKRANNSLD